MTGDHRLEPWCSYDLGGEGLHANLLSTVSCLVTGVALVARRARGLCRSAAIAAI